MGLFDGGLFDFNGDGKASFDEGFIGLMILDELMREESENRMAELLDEDDEADEDDF